MNSIRSIATFAAFALLSFVCGGCGVGLDTVPGTPKLTVYSGLRAWYRAESYKGTVTGGNTVPSSTPWQPTSGYGTPLSVIGTPYYNEFTTAMSSPPTVTIYTGGYFQAPNPANVLPAVSTGLSVFAQIDVYGTTGSWLLLSNNVTNPVCNSTTDYFRLAGSSTYFTAEGCFAGVLQSPAVQISAGGNVGPRVHQLRWEASGKFEYVIQDVGTTSATSIGPTLSLANILVIGDTGSSANASIGEVLIYDRRVSDSEADSIRLYLNRKYFEPGYGN